MKNGTTYPRRFSGDAASSRNTTEYPTKADSKFAMQQLRILSVLAVISVIALSMQLGHLNNSSRTSPCKMESFDDEMYKIQESTSSFVSGSRSLSLFNESQSSPSSPPPSNGNYYYSEVKFVFFLGIEGTGHHLLNTILRQSPVYGMMKRLKLADELKHLTADLFDGGKGYMHRHCNVPDIKYMEGLEKSIPERLKKITKTMQTELDKLNNSTDGGSEPGGDSGHALYVPLNAATLMASFPQYQNCRELRYPNLDTLYQFCDMAGIDCQHIYIYRDPYSVLKSTTINRHFNKKGPMQGMHLYRSMLSIIYADLATNSDKTVACTGLYEPNLTSESEIWHPIRDMFGWSSSPELRASFSQFIKANYRPSNPLDEASKVKLGFHKYPLYLRSLVKMHNEVIDLCHRQVKERRDVSFRRDDPVAEK